MRISELDGLRAIAILAVFIHHALNVPFLWAGVDMFFVLSGFLITRNLLGAKEEHQRFYSHFYERRVRRLLLPYHLTLLVSTVLFGPTWKQYWYYYLGAMNIAGALRLPGHDSLSSLWSLAVEEQFDFVWPTVVLLTTRARLRSLSTAVLFIVPVLRAVCTPLFKTHFPIYFLAPFRADSLCAGALIAILIRENPAWAENNRQRAYIALGAAGAALAWLSQYPWFRTGSNTIEANALLYSLVIVAASAVLTITLTGRGKLCSALRLAPLPYIGTISYTMYLIHETAIILSRRASANRWLAASLALTMTIAWAATSWTLLERRMLVRHQ